MSIKASFFLMVLVCSLNCVSGDQLPRINLNQAHNFFKKRTQTINAMLVNVPTDETPVFDSQEPYIQNILQLLPTRGFVYIIPIGEDDMHRVCTKELTNQMLGIWDYNYKQTRFYRPNYETASHFFPTVYDGIAIAMCVHGDLHLQPRQ